MDVNSQEKTYRCPNCNGIMQYDINAKAFKCPNCGTIKEIDNDQSTIVEHTLTMRAKQMLKPEEKTSSTLECTGCGATVEIEANATTGECPYCGSKYVLAKKQQDAIIPDGIVPFAIDHNRANEIFGSWIKGRWLAPRELKTLYQQSKMYSVYIPLWTFDAQAYAKYTAEGATTEIRYRRDSEGNEISEEETHWHMTSGNVSKFFDDVTVKAVSNEKAKHLEAIEPYDLTKLVSYSPEYLQGCVSQCYEIPMETANQTAHRKMEKGLKKEAENDVMKTYEDVRHVEVKAKYSKETYKHILVPMYSTGYSYKDKNYSVSINGQTGKIDGKYPYSIMKCALIAIAIIILLWIIVSRILDDREYDYYGMNTQPNVTVEQSYDMENAYAILSIEELEKITWEF